ncbi:unnamed protein product [Soboliphyme baturini]|uniref:Ephrin RBD domain-containing protein n=1 Tax=Soboliphyme baturini TaxID=241478 RepID=A0A183IDN2_9BILA|nr:unnamed protein product [Soboliphyme baturini]
MRGEWQQPFMCSSGAGHEDVCDNDNSATGFRFALKANVVKPDRPLPGRSLISLPRGNEIKAMANTVPTDRAYTYQIYVLI